MKSITKVIVSATLEEVLIFMKLRPIIILASAAILSLGTGLAAGYAIGRDNDVATSQVEYLAQSANLSLDSELAYIHNFTSTTPPALYFPEPPNNEPIPKYVLGTAEGFVAVFYHDYSLKELTRTPADSLSLSEQMRLSNGINIYTEEELVRLLQDYDS